MSSIQPSFSLQRMIGLKMHENKWKHLFLTWKQRWFDFHLYGLFYFIIISIDIRDLLNVFCFRYIDLVLVHYPKSDFRANDDPVNAVARKEVYQELEKFKGLCFGRNWFSQNSRERKI